MHEETTTSVTSAAIWRRLDDLTKPPRSLGRLEELAARLCAIQGTLTPAASPRRLVVFAADHGVAAAGVTAWPSAVTRRMIDNIRAGGAASAVLARTTGTELVLVDVGALTAEEERSVRTPEPEANRPPDCSQPAPAIRFRRAVVRPGTRNLAEEPAMTPAEFEQALTIGREEARQAAEAGVKVVAAGEMGIGNSTPAACLAMLLAEAPLAQAVGRGAGADDETLARKRRIVAAAVDRARRQEDEPVARIAAVAGFEIIAMAGFYLEAHRRKLTVVLDGYISGAAALVAQCLSPEVAATMIASHQSAEPGHPLVLRRLGLAPFLDWDLRLGEGTGALLLMPLLDAAAAMLTQMATFPDLGIRREVEP